MKKYVTASLLVLVAIGAGVAIVSWLAPKGNNVIGITPTSQNIENFATLELVLSPTELQKHNSSLSCWLLISGKIYDVTSFLPDHPGEAKTILPTCGTDATAAYASRGGTGSHSSSATAMLGDYYVGDLNQKININASSTNSKPTTSNSSTQTNQTKYKGDDDEFDD